jgi:tetratricopeptide (TPR) repeat protein
LPVVGRLFNELGLFYAGIKKYDKAISCFQHAQSAMRNSALDRKFEAVVLQNLGAIYSCLSDFNQSIEFNKKAAAFHG